MCAAITTASVGLATAGGQILSGIKARKDAKEALDSLNIPELDNAFEDIQISTIGSDLMKEESQRTSANAVDAVRSGGVRSVMGTIPKIVSATNNANRESRAYLDNQVQKRDYAIAGDNQALRGMEEQRYMGDVQGLNNMIQESGQNIWSGVRGAVSGIGSLARSIELDRDGDNGLGTTGGSEPVYVFRNGQYVPQ